MKYHFKLSIDNILKRPHFQNARVIAGSNGVNRIVKWVHVFEVIEVRGNLKGGELVLSTGFGWKENDDLFITLLKQLIQRDVAGLCIELGSFINEIPDEAIELADKHDFPIVVFDKEVSFVEITQDLHSDLINQQYEIISNIEDYSQRLNKKLLTIDNYFEILKYLQQYINCHLIYISNDHKIVTVPTVREKEKNEMLASLDDFSSTSFQKYIKAAGTSL